MPPLLGLTETCLYVEDLDRAAHFYQNLFGFPVIYQEPGRMRALRLPKEQVLILFRAQASVHGVDTGNGHIPGHDGAGPNHLAFGIRLADAAAWQAFLAEKEVPVESTVYPNARSISLYFRDPDGHLLELVTPGCWPTMGEGE